MTAAARRRIAVLHSAVFGFILSACAALPEKRPDSPAALGGDSGQQAADSSGSPQNIRSPGPTIFGGDSSSTIAAAPASGWRRDAWAEAEARLRRDFQLALDDCSFYYSPVNLAFVGLGIGLAAPLANTPADRSIRDWYQRQVQGDAWDRLADVANVGGQLWIVAPLCLEAMAWSGYADAGYFQDGGLYEWSNRSLRAIAVGFPPVVAFYGLLGSGRPDRGDSRWHPFRDIRGVSGHTFTGAVPFLTAAAMTDNLCLKAACFAGSFATGWSRLHMDRHYMSQIALGWWLAYAAVRSVDRTQESWRNISFLPAVEDGPGLGVLLRY